jgi:hexosaminidase
MSILPSALRAQAPKPLPIMPEPAHFTRGQGQFTIDGSFNVSLTGYTEPRLERARKRFLKTLSRETGIPIWHTAQFHTAKFIVETKGPSDKVQQLGENESYQLQITPSEVRLSAPNPLGILHGFQTFLQLVRIGPNGFSAPAVSIDDQPRFAWRGLMIDVSRHFIPISVLEQNIDGMEAVKLDVLHLHLSDDQGFRLESKKFPLLTGDGSDGFYYTQKQMKDLIAYARDRGIRIVPEFDMPCHTTSWVVGYPQLASAPGPFHLARDWGPQNVALDPTKASTYKFLDKFIGEMAALFPDRYFHVGGDECNGKEWNANPAIQQWMRAHHIANNAALQAYFTARVEEIVAKHHKIMEGWDEVLQPETPKNVVIQSWNGPATLAKAARQGNRAILSGPYYIDLLEPAAKHYLADPLSGPAAKLTPEQKARILGGEATMWTESVDAETIDSRIWPRTAAIAERFWSPQDVRNVDSMYRRLDIVSQNLKYHGIDPQATSEVMLERMSGSPDPVALRVLATTLQPRPGYKTACVGEFTKSFTPLNCMINALPVESVTARKFKNISNRIAAGTASPKDWQQARKWLKLWRDNDARLQPLLGRSSITKPLAPVSSSVSQVASIGLQALDDIENHATVDAGRRRQNLDFLKSASKALPGHLIDAVAPSVTLLVQATRTQ